MAFRFFLRRQTVELTEQQQRQLGDSGWPARIINPRTQEMFVLIHEQLFERVRTILEEQDGIAAVQEMGLLAQLALDEEGSQESARDQGP